MHRQISTRTKYGRDLASGDAIGTVEKSREAGAAESAAKINIGQVDKDNGYLILNK